MRKFARSQAVLRESPRSQWRAVLDHARSADGRENLTDLAHLKSRVVHVTFPVAGASAGLMAEAFLRQCGAVLTVADPEAREDFARAMSATAEALDRLLWRQQCAAAETGRRIMGERD